MASLEQNFPLEHKNLSMRRPRDVTDLAKQKEAERKKESIHGRSLSFPLAGLARQKEAERKKESIEVDISIGEKEISEIQSRSDSPATSPESFFSIEVNGAFDRSETDIDRIFTSTSGQHVSPSHENHDAPCRRDGSKIEVLELIILLANFIVELMSIAFDQLSSQHKPFLLLCLIMSISAVLISISDLVYKLIKEWDFRKGETNWRSWLFDPPPGAGVRVGFFPCITALTCAFGQFIITTVNYSVYRKHGNAPIKVSIWPTIFAFGQLFSSLSFRGAKTAPGPPAPPPPPPRRIYLQMGVPESMPIERSEHGPKPHEPTFMPIERRRRRRRLKLKSAKPKGD